ncbi:MAG: AAA family ATPase [Candidatus Vogelbacteria bacterium]|nr:AAA family ATPase [Candidatus Vogelbacteria bacterium]
MQLKRVELAGFKSFGKKAELLFDAPITAIVGPNGSGKSNVAEAFRWVLGEQSLKSLRGKRGEDLIFNGEGTRLNRASVSVVFDNQDKRLPLDFDEVTVTRTVYRDGTNEYALNGSVVRLRDILELLANVSLGPSGHHIISQGEADRILSANLYERKKMIEEALGLNIYHWKISESERKLSKTEENIREVESLRREIAPHLKFLKKQVEKVEQADLLRRELKQLYLEYLKRESDYLTKTKQELADAKSGPVAELKEVEGELAGVLRQAQGNNQEQLLRDKLRQLESELEHRRREYEEFSRSLGRLEGRLEAAREVSASAAGRDDAPVSAKLVRSKLEAVLSELTNAEGASDLVLVKNILTRVKGLVAGFVNELGVNSDVGQASDRVELIAKLECEQTELTKVIKQTSEHITKLMGELSGERKNLESLREATQGAERQSFELKTKKAELTATLNTLSAQVEKLNIEEADFKRELESAVALTDQEVRDYTKHSMFGFEGIESRTIQEERRKQIERKKIKLEDMGFEGSDVMTEYKETTKRDEFLANELADLTSSRQSLESVMLELKDRLQTEFNGGITKINEQFGQFFKQMFGGGEGKLQVVKEAKKRRSLASLATEPDEIDLEEGGEDDEAREGIDINVSLPRKKVKGLEMLSGGERALTSIALLFAMSQVNPPPFLILDETDAALDEANSRKYGDMIENLAHYSQLILITHNRETMSRAGVLYGVTMGADGLSKLLSIKFDQAESYAK